MSAGNRRSVEEIQADLVASYRAHGIEPESDLRGLASFLKAVSGPRLLCLPRLARIALDGFRRLREAERGAESTVGRAPDEDAEDRAVDSEASSEFQRAFRLYAIYGLVAVGLAAAARKTEGVVRVMLVVLAALVAAASAWSVSFMGGLALFMRIARARAVRDHGDQSSDVQPPSGRAGGRDGFI